MKRKIITNLILTLAIFASAVISPRNSENIEAIASTAIISETSTATMNREMRGAWIATVLNLNMPSGMNELEFRTWAEETVYYLYNHNFNTVIFQVRPTADALYSSEIVPWSHVITGSTQGTNPGYSPLGIMVETAHRFGMELHAWLNPYRVSMPRANTANFARNNVFHTNRDWVVEFDGQYYLNPGIPAVREHLIDVVMEIVNNYDIDAIHLDDYFFPYPVAGQTFNDAQTFLRYGANYSNIGDFRRSSVTQFIRELYEEIKDAKYWVQLGISPFGVWRNVQSDPTGSNTRAGHESYSSLFADTRTWIQEGIIDYITPQLYWSTEFPVANYNILLDWWANEIETHATTRPVNLYIGLADYKLGTDANNDPQWRNPQEIAIQIGHNRENNTAQGQMHFSMRFLLENHRNYLTNIRTNLYNTKSLTPSFYWLNEDLPRRAASVRASGSLSGVVLNIATNCDITRRFVIYRFEGSEVGEFTDENIHAIVHRNREGNTVFTDRRSTARTRYTYVVKAVSNAGVVNHDGVVLVVQN